MKISCIITCVNYSDYLAVTLPLNLLDEIIVITHTNDIDTIDVCDKLDIKCIQTSAFYEDGAAFNKGKAINIGIRAAAHDWILLLDADIVIPIESQILLKGLVLNEQFIYGVDRHSVSATEWNSFTLSKKSPYSGIFLDFGRIDGRVVWGEYIPIGFFQLFNKNSHFYKLYPVNYSGAEGSDITFAARWPRKYRSFLPEIYTIHLTTGDRIGTNWRGRKSPKFVL